MGRPTKFDDDVILDRAMRVFWRRGWSTTSIRELEEALGLTAPAIYRRFGNKDGLTRAVIDHYVERVVRHRVDRYLTGVGDPIANLSAFFASAVTAPASDAPLVGCLLTTIAVDTPHLEPAVRDALGLGFDAIDRAVRSETTRAAEIGALADGVTADDAADALMLAWHGLMVMARSGRTPAELRRRVGHSIAAIAPPGRR